MRVETINGRNLLCAGILPKTELAVGQKWAPADGTDSVVVIRELISYEDGDVNVIYGNHANDSSYEKDSFSFQCRYCLIVE